MKQCFRFLCLKYYKKAKFCRLVHYIFLENQWLTFVGCTFLFVEVDRLYFSPVDAVEVKNYCTFHHAPSYGYDILNLKHFSQIHLHLLT